MLTNGQYKQVKENFEEFDDFVIPSYLEKLAHELNLIPDFEEIRRRDEELYHLLINGPITNHHFMLKESDEETFNILKQEIVKVNEYFKTSIK
jgi:hypothetical protein